MPGKDGLSFSQDLITRKLGSKIVFVTAYDHYAIKAIKNQFSTTFLNQLTVRN